MDIEQLIADKDTRVFIDTCSLMHPEIEQFLKLLIPVLAKHRLKLYVPWSCWSELRRHLDNPKLADRAQDALEVLEIVKKFAVCAGNEADGTFADNVFLRVFTQYRPKYTLVLFTEDKKLQADILRLNQSQSVHGHRVYALGIGSILRETTNEDGTAHGTTSPFHVSKKKTDISDDPIPVKDVPQEGGCVYDNHRNKIVLKEEISAGGEGRVYAIDLSNGFVAKIYFGNKLTVHKQKKIEAIISSGLSIPGVCLPSTQLYNEAGMFVGYLMPKAEGKKLDGTIFKGERGMTRFFPSWTRKDLVALAISILTTIKQIHDAGLLIGDINGANILVKSPTEVFFVDTDSFQVNDYPCPVGTPEYTAPEIQDQDYKQMLRSVGNENFAVATLLFKLMMFGLSPYAQQDGSDIVSNIKSGNFSFPYRENSNNKIPKGDWCFFWSHLFFKLKEHFYETFRKGAKRFDESKRPGVDSWLRDLLFYQKQLSDGTLEDIDPESLKLFPKTYKKARGVKYLTCKYCHQEKPENLMADDECCKECKYGFTVAVCSKCNKEFRYKTMWGYRYGSSVTTICPACRHEEEERQREEMKRKREELRLKREEEKRKREEERRRKQEQREYRNAVYKTLTCTACNKQFTITNGEHDYYVSKGLELPKRCKDCISNNRRAPRESGESHDSGGCFITTAVCEYYGKADDCYELTMLRSFRDNWLARQEDGQAEIALYYECAPKIVEHMKASPDYAATCEELMNKYIGPCVALIEAHKEQKCRELYVNGLQYILNKYYKK